MESAEAGGVAPAERSRADTGAAHPWHPPSADSLAFSAPTFLHMLGRQGLAGGWGWRFATGEQAWSPGLYAMLGLDPAWTRLDYELFRHMMHPEDRPLLPSPAETRRGLGRAEAVVRVIRSDGRLRVLDIRTELSCDPAGRPTGIRGTALDVSDRHNLRGALEVEARRWRVFAEQAHCVSYAVDLAGAYNPLDDIVRISGVPIDEIAEDSFQAITATEREHWRTQHNEARAAGLVYTPTPNALLAGGGQTRIQAWNVPVRDGAGRIVEWAGFAAFREGRAIPVTDQMLRGAEQAVQGVQFRAARALLDWSMTNLAEASGLSFSTVRRLEEDAEAASAQTRHRAVAALRAAGIRFTMLAGGHVAVSRL